MKVKFIVFIILFSALNIFAQDSVQTFLAVQSTGVEEFHNLHPKYDGRGTLIFVLDTGVDMGIDGLKKTSTGDVKVIDVQDFTGEGDVKLYEADTDEEDGRQMFINEEKGYKVFGADKLTYQAIDGNYYIGAFKESRLINSSSHAADLNNDGDTEDTYYVVAFETVAESDSFWVAYFDTNGDDDLSDETPLRNYKVDKQSFTFKRAEGLPQLTFAVNIFPERKVVSLHFDDGAHGTHVSGIAAGYHIGNENLNGVAPGAQIISCKLGNNLFSGGATVTESMKKAYLYADKISKERKEPCIVNMSFGIGSEIEGKSEMEEFLNDLLKKNPYLYVCVANGNEGPGISSSGLPASSNYVFSSGAVLAKEVGRDLFGTSLDSDIVLYFSSRGGEVSKPDICSPGASTSTVPNFSGNDRFWGTSMASPYTAGVVSLILSGIKTEFPDIKVPSQLVFKAIRESATNMDGYTPIDQGGGLINVPRAFELLKKYIKNGEVKKFETYTISSTAPNMPNYRSQNLYLRDGSFLTGDETFSFNIKRNNFQDKNKFYRIYNIKSDSDWLIPIQKKTYLRNNQGTAINVKFDKSKMTQPGLYCSRIKAYRDDKTRFPEFDMLATVILPYHFNVSNNYEQNIEDKSIDAGKIDRYFIEVPNGQTSMKIVLSRNPKKYSMTRFRVFDPDGRGMGLSSLLYSLDNENKVEKYYYDLTPGVYEVDVEGYFRAAESSDYSLSVKFFGINRLDDKPLSSENNTVEIINLFNKIERLDLSGEMIGYKKDNIVKLEGKDVYEYPFVLKKDEAGKKFTISLSKEDFNKVTDFSLMILDSAGYAVDKNGLTYKKGSVSVSHSGKDGNEKFTLKLIPAFSNEPENMKINILEETTFQNTANVDVKFSHRNSVTLFPEIPVKLNCSFSKPENTIPDGAVAFGKIYFQSQANGEILYELPIIFNF